MTESTMAEALRAERLRAERVLATGFVKRLSLAEGVGFISADEGDEDLVVRSTGVAAGRLETLAEGQRVAFEVHEGLRGLEAFDVVPLSPS